MYEVEQRGTTAVLHVRDEVDMASRGAFQGAIESALGGEPAQLIVSFAECPYCDSTGLGVLVGVQKRIGARLTVVAPEAGVCRRLLVVSGIAKVIRCTFTLDEAFAGATV